jgi:hypothetical protein
MVRGAYLHTGPAPSGRTSTIPRKGSPCTAQRARDGSGSPVEPRATQVWSEEATSGSHRSPTCVGRVNRLQPFDFARDKLPAR